MTTEKEQPEVTQLGVFDCQVCVPADWTDEQVTSFARSHAPCGTEHGWQMRRQDDDALQGDPERQPCADREGYVHVMFDA